MEMKNLGTVAVVIVVACLLLVGVTGCGGRADLVITGSVSGLVGEAILQLSDGQQFTLTQNGGFSFQATVSPDIDYTVTVVQWPGVLGVEVDPGVYSAGGGQITDVVIDFFYLAFFTGFDGTNEALWKTDGTPEGTEKVREFDYIRITRPGSRLGTAFMGTEVYFIAYNGEENTLWKSDGTEAGTIELGESNPGFLTAFGQHVYYRADDPSDGNELCRTDGTLGGTGVFVDIYAGSSGSVPSYFTPMGSELFFCAWYYNELTELGDHELWKTDGTQDGTVLVADTYADGPSYPGYLCATDDLVFYNAYHPDSGWELYASDGTPSGTGIVTDIVAGTGNSQPQYFARLGDEVLFAATSGGDRELWKSNGTELGTTIVQNLNPGGSSYPEDLTELGGYVYFLADDGTNGEELYVSDGTPGETGYILDVNSTGDDSAPMEMQTVGRRLFFFIDHADYGYEPWAFTREDDGPGGTAGLLFDVNPGTADGYVWEED
jgi:ELWxxDGT repeat protein